MHNPKTRLIPSAVPSVRHPGGKKAFHYLNQGTSFQTVDWLQTIAMFRVEPLWDAYPQELGAPFYGGRPYNARYE